MRQFKLTDMCDKNAYSIIKNALKDKCNIAVIGMNDTGKSCFLRAMVAKVNPDYSIRVLKRDTVELLRSTYPNRNIISVGAITSVPDTLQKTDFYVNLIDNEDEDCILKVLHMVGNQTLFVSNGISDRVAKSMINEEKSGLAVEMKRNDNGIPYVASINEISYDGSHNCARIEVYKRV